VGTNFTGKPGEAVTRAKRGYAFVWIDQRKGKGRLTVHVVSIRIAVRIAVGPNAPCEPNINNLQPFPELSTIFFSFYSHDHVAYISVQPNASRPRPQVLIVFLCTQGPLSHFYPYSVLFFLPLASALSNLQVTSQNPSSGGSVTITWSQDSSDPSTFSLELANENFHNTFALANNVQTSSQQITVTIPIVAA
jgi:hypothetical protein